MVKNKNVEVTKETETPVEEVETVETVEVEKSKLDSLLTAFEKQQKEIETLKETVSSTRYKEAEERANTDKRPRVHFKQLQGKVVIGWPDKGSPDKKNEVIINPVTNSPVGEVIKSKYYFVDGTSSEMIDQVEFTRVNDLVFARVTQDLGGAVEVEFEDKSITQEKITVDKRFLNA